MANTDRPIIPPQLPIPVLAYDAPSLHLPAIVLCCRMLAIALAVPAIEPILTQEERRYMITLVLRIIVGLWLVLGTSGILKMIRSHSSHSGRWRDDPNSEEQVDKGKEGPNV